MRFPRSLALAFAVLASGPAAAECLYEGRQYSVESTICMPGDGIMVVARCKGDQWEMPQMTTPPASPQKCPSCDYGGQRYSVGSKITVTPPNVTPRITIECKLEPANGAVWR